MKARNFSNVRFAQAMTAVALGGALAMVACAGNGTSGGNGGSAGPTGQGGTSSNNGGNSGNGGSTTNPGGNGGSTGGGSCPSTPSGGTVNFCNGKAQGAMTGVGWVTLGSSDSISDPTCDTDKHAITKANACTTTTNWSSSDGLCTSGSIPALPATPVQSDYDNNFGIEIGVNTSQPSDAGAGGPTLGGSYTSVTFTVSGTPTTGLRAQVHRLGDGDKGVFCATMPGISSRKSSTTTWPRAKTPAGSTRAFRPSPTATCTSGTPSRSA
jgi:hypothetical protein